MNIPNGISRTLKKEKKRKEKGKERDEGEIERERNLDVVRGSVLSSAAVQGDFFSFHSFFFFFSSSSSFILSAVELYYCNAAAAAQGLPLSHSPTVPQSHTHSTDYASHPAALLLLHTASLRALHVVLMCCLLQQAHIAQHS